MLYWYHSKNEIKSFYNVNDSSSHKRNDCSGHMSRNREWDDTFESRDPLSEILCLNIPTLQFLVSPRRGHVLTSYVVIRLPLVSDFG